MAGAPMLSGGTMSSPPYRVVLSSLLILSFTLFPFHVSAQSPPTATEAFNLRIKCKKMAEQKAQEIRELNTMVKWEYVAAWHTSKYDPINNRCYGRIYEHIAKPNYHFDHETDQVLDLQTDDALAMSWIEEGKRHGSIWDPDYKKPWLPTCVGGCPANFGDQTWQAAEDYTNEMMADPRKQ
jgi:hypothetical protein